MFASGVCFCFCLFFPSSSVYLLFVCFCCAFLFFACLVLFCLSCFTVCLFFACLFFFTLTHDACVCVCVCVCVCGVCAYLRLRWGAKTLCGDLVLARGVVTCVIVLVT